MAFTWWATPYVVSRINPPDDPAPLALSADWTVVGFGTALALGVTVLFGMLPALRASGVRPVSALKGGEEPRSKTKWMQAMIAAQVAFCFVVLFLARLFAMTEAKLARRPMGFVAERLLLLDTVARLPQPPVKWDQMAAVLRNVPGVQATALGNWPLLSGGQPNDRVSVNGSVLSEVLAFFLEVSPRWLDAMRIGMVDGRDFRENDTAPSVVIVNEAFAKQYFRGRSPVGQSFDTRPAFGAERALRDRGFGKERDVSLCARADLTAGVSAAASCSDGDGLGGRCVAANARCDDCGEDIEGRSDADG
jgi:hypothetical protein